MIKWISIFIFVSLIILYSSLISILIFPKKEKKYRKYYPNISIILPAHNEEKVIKNTLLSLINANYPNKKEIIVVNDGSTDNTAKVVKEMTKKYPLIKLINLKHGGKANALNTGVSHSKYDIVITLDADSSIEKNSLKELVKPLSERDVAGVSGVVRAKRNKNLLTWFQDFDYIVSSGWRFICNKINANSILPGFAAFKKDVLIKAKGFKTDTITEDFDIVLELRRLGYHTRMNPSAVIYTEVPQTIRKFVRQRIRWGRGTIQVIRKHIDFIASKKSGLLGLYSIPTQSYWYLHGLLYIPITLYTMVSGYFKYFVAHNNFISFSVVKYFFSWLSLYGMIEYFYRVITGIYPFDFLSLLVIIVFSLSFIYTILVFKKIAKVKTYHLIVYFFFSIYSILVLVLMGYSFLYELTNPKAYNKWEK